MLYLGIERFSIIENFIWSESSESFLSRFPSPEGWRLSLLNVDKMSRSLNLAINVRLSNAYRTLMIHWIRFRHDRFHYLEENSIFFDFKSSLDTCENTQATYHIHIWMHYIVRMPLLVPTNNATSLVAFIRLHRPLEWRTPAATWLGPNHCVDKNGKLFTCANEFFLFNQKFSSPLMSTSNDLLAAGLSLQAISGRPVPRRVFSKDWRYCNGWSL